MRKLQMKQKIQIKFSLLMQIRELTLPPNQRKITYQISKSGKTNIYTSSQKQDKKLIYEWEHPKIQLGQLNSIQLTQQNKLQNILEKNPFEAIKKIQKLKQQGQKKIICSCKKSRCLKMYCECFSSKFFCGDLCSCRGCANTEINSKKLLIIRQELDSKKQVEQKGCKCQKSGCNKKYCECFSKNKKCGTFCQCVSCQNMDGNSKNPKKQDLN